MTDTRQESGRKRLFTSGRAVATGAVALVAAIAALLTNINTIREWFEPPGPPYIHISDLMVHDRYPVDLYDFSHQAPRSVWNRTIPPADRGCAARLSFHAEKKDGDAAEDCIVVEGQDAKPMWKWLDRDPPPNSFSERDGQLYVRSEALAFIGADNYSVGSFKRGRYTKDVEFEVFFREKQSIRVRLACRGSPRSIWLAGELNEPVNTAPPRFRVRGYPC